MGDPGPFEWSYELGTNTPRLVSAGCNKAFKVPDIASPDENPLIIAIFQVAIPGGRNSAPYQWRDSSPKLDPGQERPDSWRDFSSADSVMREEVPLLPRLVTKLPSRERRVFSHTIPPALILKFVQIRGWRFLGRRKPWEWPTLVTNFHWQPAYLGDAHHIAPTRRP